MRPRRGRALGRSQGGGSGGGKTRLVFESRGRDVCRSFVCGDRQGAGAEAGGCGGSMRRRGVSRGKRGGGTKGRRLRAEEGRRVGIGSG